MPSGRRKGSFAVVPMRFGAIGLLAPKRHALAWNAGPKTARKVARFFANSPKYMRLPDRTQIGFGPWLASGQYRKD